MSSLSFASSEAYPSTSGLHLIGAFHVMQVDHIIACQQSKRRGGPKKATLAYRITDERQHATAADEAPEVHSAEWKTISQKNFSNRDNISQYTRNPFGSRRSGSGESAHLLVVHGARTGKKVSGGVVSGAFSNTVGVNLTGKTLAQHPRFLLSSGKGELGARSTMLFYHANPHARVELTQLWIEHKTLKVTLEQFDEDEAEAAEVPLVNFSPKFKQLYGATANGQEDAEITPPIKQQQPAPTKRTAPAKMKLPPSELSRDSSVLSTLSTASPSSALSALPPVEIPQGLVDRLARRKRIFDESIAHSFSSVDAGLREYDERAYKKHHSEEALGIAFAASFGGFHEQLALGQPLALGMDQQALDESMMITDDLLLEGCDTPDTDSDVTPRMACTPPPFMHDHATVCTESQSSVTSSEASCDEDMFPHPDMLLFEQQLEKYEPAQSPQPTAAPAAAELPLPLKTAHQLLAGNPYQFAAFQAGSHSHEAASLDYLPPPSFPVSSLSQSPPPALFDVDFSLKCHKQRSSLSGSARLPAHTVAPSPATVRTPPMHHHSPYAHLFAAGPPPPVGRRGLCAIPPARALPPSVRPPC